MIGIRREQLQASPRNEGIIIILGFTLFCHSFF
jgi:hypothetical protein